MQAKRGLSERSMSAFGRGTVRKVLLSGLSAVAIACAASVAFADPLPPLEPSLGGEMRTLAPFASEITRGSFGRVSSPQSSSNGRASFGRPWGGEDQGGGSRCPSQQASGAFDNLLGPHDPPPRPAPTRGGGCANAIGSVYMRLPPFPLSPPSA